MTGHTPGPWTAVSFSSVVGCPITAQPDPNQNTIVVAGTHSAFGADFRGEVEANARLIAAAPDLLDVLDMIAGICEGSRTANSLPHLGSIARAAIAKATQP